MSRTRIVKGDYIKISAKNHNMFSEDNILMSAGKSVNVNGEEKGETFGNPSEPPKPPMLNYLEPILNGDIIFCNGYLSSPKKNPGSYLNVILDRVPDDVSQNPMRAANMNEKKLTDDVDIYTNDELEIDNRRGGGTLYSDPNYEKTEDFRWTFAAKERFEGYWEGYDNVSKKRYSQVFKEYFHANGNAHFINGSHGLQSSGAHRVEHGIAQGYAWAKRKWNIKEKSEIDKVKDKKPGVLSYSPQYKPITVVGHSQGAAIAAGVALGVLYYAFEMGWEEIPINILFLGTHQPQGLYGKDYEEFLKYYFEDFIKEWVLEWVADIFSKEKLYQNQGIYEKMNELIGNAGWGGLLYRAVQFTFPNDRALFVTRMGDIPYVKNACNEKDAIQFVSWMFVKQHPPEGFFDDEGYQFPTRLLDKAFNSDGSLKEGAPTYRQTVKTYWASYNVYKNYRDSVVGDPQKKYARAKYEIPVIERILPDWFYTILDQSISKVEGAKKELYMKSELYRLKINALLAFTHVHEMELQAHFAPVGLMFNKGVLSDWDQYQDETIWDRIKDAGKELFYRLDYSQNATNEQKRKQEKAFVEGEGTARMVRTSIANTSGIKKWVDQAKDELKVNRHWYSDIVDWYKGDKLYDGSGWAHGARQSLAKSIGFTDGNINSLFEAGIYSMLQSGEVDISKSQRLIKMINEDPAFIEYEKEIAKKIIQNPLYKNKSFEIKDLPLRPIQLGGKRAKGDMLDQFKNPFSTKYKDTWKVAANELTWLLRSIGVITLVSVDKYGGAKIQHKFNDTFDLRASKDGSRSIEYDVVSIITGFLYHDIAGGNDLMQVKGNWKNKYSKEQIDWKANGDQRIKKMLENIQQKQDSIMREYNKLNEYNRTTFPLRD